MERPVLETCPLLMPAAFLAMGIALGVANGAAGQRWAVALLLAAVLLTTQVKVFRPGYVAPVRKPRKEAGPKNE